MAQDKSVEFTSYALSRMSARVLSEAHVWFCKFHQTRTYKVGGDTVWVCKLPDGRNMKVRVRNVCAKPIIVVDVFTYM